jgi:hypothetical protein
VRAHTITKTTRRGRNARCRAFLIVLAVSALAIPATASAQSTTSADTVREWNLHASNALMNATPNTVPTPPIPGAGQPPHVAQPHLAMVQGAVYDAVNSIDGGHQPYLANLPPVSGPASKKAAVATAAHDVLVGLRREDLGALALPQVVRDRLDDLYADELAGIPGGAAKTDNGIAAGAAAADKMLEVRADDGRYGDFRFTPGTLAGQWRPTTSGTDQFAWVAKVDPFLIESQSQFRTQGPHALTSEAYTREYNEVKELGVVASPYPAGPRTAEQDAVARFYNVNLVELFNRAFREIAEDRGLTLADEARLFAMLNLATADAVINCWDEKKHWSNWRPITAIREGDNDGNPSTVGDPGWTPLIPTPPYPEHTSGYNCGTSAYMHTAKAFFGGDEMEFSVVRKAPPPVADVKRKYERFTDVIDDTIDARVYQGIHFRAADVQGAEIGKDVAHWLEEHYFQPVN